MTAINRESTKIMNYLLATLNNNYSKIDNSKSFMAVTIEKIWERHYSIAHYGVQNGDLMRDPEVCFYYSEDEKFYPYYFRNDYIGKEEYSMEFDSGKPVVTDHYLQARHATFAQDWLRNIKEQQDLEVL